MKSIKETILEKIKEDKLEMRPRLYFTIKIILLILLGTAILVLSVFIFNFILFSIRLNSQDELLGFGPRGILAFIIFFPWSWLVVDIVFIGLLQTLIRKFRFGYQIPVIYLLAGVVGATLLLGFTFDRGTDLNDRILRRADEHHLPPPVLDLYGHARRPIPVRNGICRCIVVDVYQDQMVVADNRFGTTTLLLVRLPMDNPHATSTSIKKGDIVFIAGELKDGVIEAFGVKKILIRKSY